MANFQELVPAGVIDNVRQAWAADPAFSAAFLADPKSAYRGRFGFDLLPGHDVTLERVDGGLRIAVSGCDDVVVPLSGSASSSGELSDDDLEFSGATPPAKA